MKSFGYSISSDRQIDYDSNNKEFARFIDDVEPSARLCMGCGSCTATCSAGHFTDFNIRRVHTFIQRGEIHHLKKEIMKCMLCGKCQLVCPRGVNLRNLILSIHSALVNCEK
jgi:heterodisulfide reductase subunit C